MNSTLSSNSFSGNAAAKYEYVRDRIAEAVKRGEFRPGQQLPSERELAERFDVSYMTARRAVSQLVAARVLVRKDRRGTFVAEGQTPVRPVTLNIICSVDAQPPVSSDAFISLIAASARDRDWQTRVIRIDEGHQEPAAKAVVEGDVSIVRMHDFNVWRGLRAALAGAGVANRTVIIGSRLDHLGLCSVVADNGYATRLAIEHLRSRGHERIGFMIRDSDSQSMMRLRVAVWRSFFPEVADDVLESRLIRFPLGPYESETDHAYVRAKAYLSSGEADITALLCLNTAIAVGALAACRDTGIAVPGAMSLMCTGDTALARFSNPPITAIDYDAPGEVAQAMAILDRMLAGTHSTWDMFRMSVPRLVERESVMSFGGG